jgi:hypothetical protein
MVCLVNAWPHLQGPVYTDFEMFLLTNAERLCLVATLCMTIGARPLVCGILMFMQMVYAWLLHYARPHVCGFWDVSRNLYWRFVSSRNTVNGHRCKASCMWILRLSYTKGSCLAVVLCMTIGARPLVCGILMFMQMVYAWLLHYARP